jgi:hypothetical protein
MARRENNIDGIRLYSDNLEEANSKPSKTVQSYKKVETTTTTRRFVKEGSNPSQTTVTKKRTKITKDLGVPRKSINEITGNIQEMISSLQGGKDKYTYSGKLKEKSNYLYYVSGIGYVTKEGIPAKDNKPKEVKVMKQKPQPARVVKERVTIVIQNKRPEKKGGDLVENFQYYESKDLGKNNKESIVVHKRKGDPFYQSIHGKRSSSYTHAERSRASIEKTEIQSRTIETKTTTQRNQYQNKTYNTTKTAQTGAGRGNRKNESSYQRTINVEERKRNIIPKTRFEKTYTEINKRTTSGEQKKYVPPPKKYQEKTDESYKRKTQTQNNQKVVDTEKYKRNVEQNKYQQKTEETQQTRVSQDQNMLNDPNYCPIHGYHGQGSIDDIDNYKFYESKSVTTKINTNLKDMNTNINTNENFNRQNIINTEENINTNMAYMNQEQMAQAEEGYDLSKLYIATKITPVYSEMLDQQFQTHTHVCKVCGNAYDDNQMEMMQQNQINSMQEQNQVNSMQEMEYDINCPIHGQYFTQ